MTRFADPRRCPDCGGAIDEQDSACPACRLPLRGVQAQQLFEVLTLADTLLAALRRSAPPATTAAGAGTAASGLPAGRMPASAGSLPGGAVPAQPPPHRRGLSAASVPKILLALGAACLLVAALVFLAVTWSVMGVGGRTATLVLLTAVTASLAAWMARRHLRGAAESLALVALGLLSLDLVGARSAGWFGDLPDAGFLVLLGTALVASGSAASVVARRSPVRALTAPELVAGIGAAVLTAGVATLDAVPRSTALVLAVLAALALCAGAAALGLRLGSALSGGAAALAWLAQLGHAVASVGEPSLEALWAGGDAVELLASAVLAGLVAAVRPLPLPARVAAGSVATTVVSFVAVLPALDESATAAAAATLGSLAAAGVVCWLLPRPWGLVATGTQLLAGAAMVVLTALVVATAGSRLGEVAGQAWGGTVGGPMVGPVPTGLPAPWLAPLAVAALLGTGAALARVSRALDALLPVLADPRVWAVLLLGSSVAALASATVPVWTVLGALLVPAAAFLGWWLVRPTAGTLLAAAGFLAGAVTVGAYDEWLTVVALAAALLGAGAVHLRASSPDVAAAAGAVLAATVAGSAWTWGALVQAPGTWTGLVGLLLLAAVVLTLPIYADHWWRTPNPVAARAGIEVGAAAAALPLGLAGVATAAAAGRPTWTAVYLTVAGAALVAEALLRGDRRMLAWAGSGLLVLASWVRLADLGVEAPEPYTLPAAVALTVLGLLRLRREAAADTLSTLAPGLVLGTAPSLVWTLEDPRGLRALLLGLACLALVLAGLQARWSAPLLVGAAVGAVLVVRLAAPYVGEAVPRWVLIGSAGALLIATGVTWERRLQEARHLTGYLRALR